MDVISFEVCSKKTQEHFAVFTNEDFDEFFIGSIDNQKEIDLNELMKDYDIFAISEAVAQKGFEGCIFFEYFAPFVSVESLCDYIQGRKEEIIRRFFYYEHDEELKSLIASSPDLYNGNYFDDDDYEDGIRCILDGIVKDGDSFSYKTIRIEVADIELARFTLEKDTYKFEITINRENDSERDAKKLHNACFDILSEALKNYSKDHNWTHRIVSDRAFSIRTERI